MSEWIYHNLDLTPDYYINGYYLKLPIFLDRPGVFFLRPPAINTTSLYLPNVKYYKSMFN